MNAAASKSLVQHGVDPKEGINLEYVETVLIKFTLASRDEVLSGIPERKRLSQVDLDMKHIEEAKDLVKQNRIAERKLQRGSIRPGHYDTGVEVYHCEADVGSPTLAECLMKEGYGFRDVHFFKQLKGRPLYVVVFGFEWNTENVEDVADLQKKFAHYAGNSWTTSVWDNPNLTSTVNLTNRIRGVRPTRKVIAAKKHLFIV